MKPLTRTRTIELLFLARASGHKVTCSVAEAQYLDAMHTFQKVIYNACSVVMLTVCMLMLCSSVQLDEDTDASAFCLASEVMSDER